MATKSSIVSGMGLAMSIVQALTKAVQDAGGTEEDIHRLATDEGENILIKVAEVIVGKVPLTFRVVVDHTMNLDQMIEQGRYGWASSDITQDNFPVKGSGQEEVEVALFHFNRIISSEQVISEIEKAGFRSATIEELLALGAKHQKLQDQFRIVTFGHVWKDRLSGLGYVVCLEWCSERGRILNVYPLVSDNWNRGYRFAAVRK